MNRDGLLVGTIIFYSSNEIIQYLDKEEFIKDFKDALYNYGISGWCFELYDDELRKKINEILANEFGEIDE